MFANIDKIKIKIVNYACIYQQLSNSMRRTTFACRKDMQHSNYKIVYGIFGLFTCSFSHPSL